MSPVVLLSTDNCVYDMNCIRHDPETKYENSDGIKKKKIFFRYNVTEG